MTPKLRRLLRWALASIAVASVTGAALALAADQAVPLRQRPDRVTCGFHSFPSSALDSHKGVERGSSAPARALARFLRGRDARDYGMPRHGWRTLVRRRHAVEYGHSGPRGQVGIDEATADREYGRWSVGEFGGCDPERVVRAREVVPWHLRLRRHRRLRATDRVLHLELETGTCYPGTDAGEHPERRFDHAEVAYTRHRVGLLVLLRAEQVPRAGACAGVGLLFPRDVKLPSPLGHRTLVDLRTVPATVIHRASK